MPDLPYFPLYPKDLLADHKVLIMDAEQFGAYMRLLCIAWHENPPATLPQEDAILAAYSRLNPARWQVCKPVVLAPFDTDGRRYVQKRMKAVHDEMIEKHRNRVKAGSLGGRPKANGKQCFPNASLRASGSGSGSSVAVPEGVQREPDSPPWTREQFAVAAKSAGVGEADRDACWAFYDSQGWFKSNGRRITGDPRSLLLTWMANPRRMEAGGVKPMSAFEIKTRLEACEQQRGRLGAPSMHATAEQWAAYRATEKGKRHQELTEEMKRLRAMLTEAP